jgi:hypothetical protein
MHIRRTTFNGTSNRLTKRANGSTRKVPHYARINSNPTGGSKRRKIALTRVPRRYYSSGGAGPALNAEIAAIDAVFNVAVGGANLTKVQVKEALKAHKLAHPTLSENAKTHLLTLMTSLSHHSSRTVITPALLAADRTAIQAAQDAAVSKDVASRSCARPDPLSERLDHRSTDPKSKPTSPRG